MSLRPASTGMRFLPAFFAAFTLLLVVPAQGQTPVTPTTNFPAVYGPYNVVSLPDGPGVRKAMDEHDTVQMADAAWTMYAWVRPQQAMQAPALIAGMGETADEYGRFLAVSGSEVLLWDGPDNLLRFPLPVHATLEPGQWHFIAASFDGKTFRVYADGQLAGSGTLLLGSVTPALEIAPAEDLPAGFSHFGGQIEGFTVLRQALSDGEIAGLASHRDEIDPIEYEQASQEWPIQTRGWGGYRTPQDPATLPHGKAPFSAPLAKPLPSHRAPLTPRGDDEWLIGDWSLQAAPKVAATEEQVASPGYDAKNWMAATVPGTVLTTMVDRGVYPDPYYGLNNLVIPESLNKQDYWYRTVFPTPKDTRGRKLTLTFEGINYQADVWLNGQSLGTIKGAFIRGIFDVTHAVKSQGENVLLVRIAPPPHPGIPQEQSVLGGPGENGGLMCLDGPTFVATEGWDWVPGIRDRDSGIWQPVVLKATGNVKIGDPQVVTTLPLPDISRADVRISVPLTDASDAPVAGTLTAGFEGVTVTKQVNLKPGDNTITLTPAEFSQLTVDHPRLWWPNGYGAPNLYHLKLSFSTGLGVSDAKQIRFGMREVTYDVGLLDATGHLRDVEFDPSRAVPQDGPVVDVSHQGMRQIPPVEPPPPFYPPDAKQGWRSWVSSLTAAGASSPAIRPVPTDEQGTRPYLVIRVNGVRIAARGGNWGMDDAMKNVSRAHLEPYFRLHRDAHVNIIRNWVGQSTEQTFYDLADEYGLMVWNDFWDSTQNYNIEAQDPALFLRNAEDVILRFRNHPSIVVWCGRNEGVPQPIINQGLDHLIREFDGTRYYSPSSNEVNLQGSGPYHYQDPRLYYTRLNHGFSVETGTPSMSTRESFEAWTPKPDQWPIDDVWAYHDWHQSGNGDTHYFMGEMQAEFGAPTSLADFERKAQMLNYVDHRAIFEGMNAHLWAPNSARMLWMTQPAWPSNMWEILSWDYDTQASFYGVEKACEPMHVQLDLSNGNVQVVNTTRDSQQGLTVMAEVFSLDNKSVFQKTMAANSSADQVMTAFPLDLPSLTQQGVVLIHLQLKDSSGKVLSHNLYWLGAKSEDYRALLHLPESPVNATATFRRDGDEVRVSVQLTNGGSAASLQDKLTLVDASGQRILPAYYSDNYISLLPGESREITIEYPGSATSGAPHLTLRGWNLSDHDVAVAQ